MSLRIQIFSVIIGVAFCVIATVAVTQMYLARSNVIGLEKDNLRVVADLADGLITNRIEYLKLGVGSIAQHVAFTDDDDLETVLQRYGNEGYRGMIDFSALLVLEKIVDERDGTEKIIRVAASGNYPVRERFLLEKKPNYVLSAFKGEFAASTTVRFEEGSDSEQPQVVIFLCMPIEQVHEGQAQRILCAVLDGLFIVNRLKNFKFWNGMGDIVLCDGEGTLLSTNIRDPEGNNLGSKLVSSRTNYIRLAEELPELRALAVFFKLVISGETGHHEHVFHGERRGSYYRPLTGSTMGWGVAATAPVLSSPYRGTPWWIIIPTIGSMIVCCVIAYIASSFLTKPHHVALQAKQAAEKASEAKTTFLANMSHEMRTPLNAVIGLAELTLGSGEAKGEIGTNLEKIYNSGLILLSTINDLLDISKIESGKLELIPTEYDLPSLINDTAALNSVRIGSKPIQFMIEVDENLPGRFLGDELRIKQMLNNLLSNAFKYTHEGQVTWSIGYELEGHHFFIVFKISDTGIGIRQEDMSALFHEYSQLDSKANRQIEGTGLGLSLVRRMTALMGGTVTVESEYGKGSTFTLRVQQTPLNDTPIGRDVAFNLAHMRFSQSKLARNARMTRLKLPYARVLVVDDVQTNLDVARGMLNPYEMQVDCVTSGQQAIDTIRNETVRYNAIFMDHMMPGMDGIEATRRIREIGTPYAQTIPIIALTANAILGNEEMFLKRGFQAFLSKPIDIMRLDIEIRRWVRDRTQESSAILETNSPPSAIISIDSQTSTWTIEGIDKDKALKQFGESEETCFIVLNSFVTNTPGLLDKIRGCTESQLSDYAVLIHGIKGTCRGICADVVGEQAEKLEHAAEQGNYQYVSEHNSVFIETVEELMERIKATLQEHDHH